MMNIKSLCITCAALVVVLVTNSASATETELKTQTLCGWFENPTTANIFLIDRSGEWTIGIQGGQQIEDDWPWPKFNDSQWVKNNGNYGYGCACITGIVNVSTRDVISISSTRAQLLSICRNDRTIKMKEPAR
jgi:hypothetical protein